ncbi:MAG TPA: sulfite exporter TauE/SafE family protein [Acetobacteraceae bacterium]|nr:sulfite exporter TauE/SafE family protein [Acetobacteraceae bacterium]
MTKPSAVQFLAAKALAFRSNDLFPSGTIIAGGALIAPVMMDRCAQTVQGVRYPAKLGGIFLVGAFTVWLYSKFMPASSGADATLVDLILFGAATVSSIGGFAFSALSGAVLFHTRMDNIEVVQTMLLSSIGIQLLMIATIWKSIDWRRFCRFLIGGLVGIPCGLFVLLHVERHLFAAGFGALLCAYSAYVILRPPFVVSPRLAWLDPLIGFAGGITGGAVAFPGAPVTAWCQLKGWTRDQQRGIYQPFILVMQIASLSLMSLVGKSAGHPGMVLHHLNSVPPALAGALVGIYIYRKSTDRTFSVVINSTLFVSGLTLLF